MRDERDGQELHVDLLCMRHASLAREARHWTAPPCLLRRCYAARAGHTGSW